MSQKQSIVEYIDSKQKDVDIEVREVNEYRNQVDFIKGESAKLTIENDEDMEKASDLLNQVKKVSKAITERKELITRPLLNALAEARNLFKPFETDYSEAEKTIKAKMLVYSNEVADRIEKEKLKVEKRVEKGTMRTDTAVKKLEDIGEAQKSYGKTSIQTRQKVRVVDESLIPREYLIVDTVKLNNAVLKEGKVVPGAEIVTERIIVGSTR